MVDAIAPVTDEDVQTARRRRRARSVRRKAGALATIGVAAAILLSLHGESASHRPSTVAVGIPATSPAMSSAIGHGVEVQFTFPSRRWIAGVPVRGLLVVVNDSGHALEAGLVCRDEVFAVGLSNGSLSTAAGLRQQGCDPGFAFPPGATRLPFTAPTTYYTGGRAVPLPPGSYRAHLALVEAFDLPLPPPVQLALVAAKG